MDKKNICVVVLGDIGRSPRMQYHSESFAQQGDRVDIVCYRDTLPKPTLIAQPLVSFHYLAPFPSLKLPKFLNYILKTIWQAVTLLFVLCIIRKPTTILVQNPPAVPALLVCWLFSILCGAKYVIDWHNYAHSIMALNVGKGNLLVRITKQLEKFAGRRANSNLCVTNEMKNDLDENWGIKAITLYDKPAEIFKPISIEDKHEMFMKLSKMFPQLGSNFENETAITKIKDDRIVFKNNRPGILISSTSWTEDEDFSVLLTALQNYEEYISNGNENNLPHLICIITGKGPLKNFYLDKIKQINFKFVQVITPWLEAKDYPKIVASADLGVCLHTSSSGFDLPMKVVDMFGCGIPVCAYNFKSLYELVKHEENSFVFNNTEELTNQLLKWFENFPNNNNQQELYKKFQIGIKNFRDLGWKENWKRTALNAFEN